MLLANPDKQLFRQLAVHLYRWRFSNKIFIFFRLEFYQYTVMLKSSVCLATEGAGLLSGDLKKIPKHDIFSFLELLLLGDVAFTIPRQAPLILHILDNLGPPSRTSRFKPLPLLMMLLMRMSQMGLLLLRRRKRCSKRYIGNLLKHRRQRHSSRTRWMVPALRLLNTNILAWLSIKCQLPIFYLEVQDQ